MLGICGGYEMLAEQLDDGVESRSGLVPGLGLLPVRVLFDDDKTVRVATHDHRGTAVTGYEIHHGRCRIDGGEPFLDGVRSANTWGTMLHGCLENDDFRRALLSEVAALTGSGWSPDERADGYAQRRERMIETLADAMTEHLDVDALLALAKESAR